jgi:quercetin dioxygenase-like cupin family protein
VCFVQPDKKEVTMDRKVLRLFVLAVVLIFPLAAIPAWAYDESPDAEEEGHKLPTGVSLTDLSQLAPIELPQEPATLEVVRITLEPGAVAPAHPHTGPEIAVIEAGSGTTRTVEGPAAQLVHDDAGSEAAPQAPSKEVNFAAGDAVIVPTGNVSEARAGDDGYSALVFAFTTQAAEATPEP